ncbi:GNAT family N-acetyltransferase [Streptomyces oceani]|uniref:GCN5 family acetyltransferase n=1 Tax=Streptomyces oceani TaxID=1075402 RepID=A0A1E7KGT1_9ACTN|nr:GNAT family N-acetyltransferase [Streptomyces oceani]OEV03139.1 GCN5 family acetyltransferase [Streptomyces oceani]
MDPDALLTDFDVQLRQRARGGAGADTEQIGGVVRLTAGPGRWSGVVWSDLDEGTADRAIAAQVRHYAVREREFEWKLYAHDEPADLGARLRAAGFRPEPRETVMVANVAELATEVVLPEGVRLRPVTDPDAVEPLAEAHAAAFGTGRPELAEELRAQLAGEPETVAMVVATARGRPVSGARVELPPHADFAGLWGGGTAPAWRGCGIYRALVAYRARIAAERGYRYLHVDASEQSRPILRRLGFIPLTTTTPYVHRPPGIANAPAAQLG